MSDEDKFDDVVAEFLQLAGAAGVKAAQDTTLFNTSQSFRDAIITQPLNKNTQVVWSTAPWSSYLEEGNNQGGPFIYPTKAKALHFFIHGKEVFAKKVRSHGPLPYMTESKIVVEEQVQSIWEQAKRNKL